MLCGATTRNRVPWRGEEGLGSDGRPVILPDQVRFGRHTNSVLRAVVVLVAVLVGGTVLFAPFGGLERGSLGRIHRFRSPDRARRVAVWNHQK